jgi:aspartate kinase
MGQLPAGESVVVRLSGERVGDPGRLRDAARGLVALHDRGHGVVVVLDAAHGAAKELRELALSVSPRPEPRELDLLVSVGSRQACALCAMAIIDLGRKAVSLTGSQAGVVTDSAHGEARLVEVRPRRIERALEAGEIVLVAGGQGVSAEHEVTTLEPGGADRTAVALASALDARLHELTAVEPTDAGLLPLPSGRG